MKQSKRKQKPAPAPQSTEQVSNPQVAAPIAATIDKTGAAPSAPVASSTIVIDGETSFALGTSCTMREAAAIKLELMKVLSVKKTVVLDVSAIERIDTSAMQLLCAFVRDRRARRLTTRWTGNPQVFVDAVQVLGLTQALSYQPARQAA